MTKYPLEDLVAYCGKDDPLKEMWLWAQAMGLAITIAMAGGALLSISNVLVTTYTAVMSKLCAIDFSLSSFNAWQEFAGNATIYCGLAVGAGAIFAKLWLNACHGSPVVKRNIQLALGLEDAAKLCQNVLPPYLEKQKRVSSDKVIIHIVLSRSRICTRHMIIKAVYADKDHTSLFIDTLPLMNGPLDMLSALYSDFGENKNEAEGLISDLQPYKANSSRRNAGREGRKKRNAISHEQVMREAPPKLSRAERELIERRSAKATEI